MQKIREKFIQNIRMFRTKSLVNRFISKTFILHKFSEFILNSVSDVLNSCSYSFHSHTENFGTPISNFCLNSNLVPNIHTYMYSECILTEIRFCFEVMLRIKIVSELLFAVLITFQY